LRLLAAGDRSEQEAQSRLSAAGFAPQTVLRTMARLRRLRYLDDQRAAGAAAARAARNGRGSERTRAELGRRGFPASAVDEALAAAFEDEVELARRAVTRKYPAPQNAKERARVARFLAARGFPETVVLAIVGEGC
jgi:SOS response regulatory protein OraA/RecX